MVVFRPRIEEHYQQVAKIPLVVPLSLSPLIRFGTSTWTYESWQGEVYQQQPAKSMLAWECRGSVNAVGKVTASRGLRVLLGDP